MNDWKNIISASTNAIFARRMIYKIGEYQKKYPNLDVDSIAIEFAESSDKTKKEWATYTNNMESIVKTCRVQRKIKRDAEYAVELDAWNKHDLENNEFYDGDCRTENSNNF